MPETRKLAALLAADIAGYSRLTGSDEDRTLARLRGLRSDLIDPSISVHHGRVVKRTGDGVLVEFRSVVDAVRCAIEVQDGMAERNAGLPPERRIEFRVGIHLGDVVEESDGDLMGDGVNIAARLEGLAKPGAICLSEDAYRQVRARLDLAVNDLGVTQLKNIAEPVRVYSLEVGRPALAGKGGEALENQRPARSRWPPMVAGMVALLLLVGAFGVYQFGVPSWMSQALGVSPPTNTLHEALLARLAAYLVADAERQIVAQKYEAEGTHKALAISLEKHRTWRTARWPTIPEAETGALEGCQIFYGKPCALVVTDDTLAAAGDPSRVRDMPRPHYADTFDLQQIPRARADFLKRPDVVNYASAPGPKAAAFHPDGVPSFATVTGASTQFDAEEQALAKCNAIAKESGGLCFVYAVGNQVVLPQRSTRPLTARQSESTDKKH
jgi:class 3 adenylate cyclase